MQTLLKKIGEIQKKQIIKQTEVSRRGENFNVFNVLGLWSEEVRLHSAMLAELLNPDGSHGCGEAFLKIFIEEVLKIEINDATDVLNKAVTTTEYYIGRINDDGTEGGRIDILIDMPHRSSVPSLIIENKIYASDQSNQLLRYYNFAKDKYRSTDKFKILYLSLYGSTPSVSSVGENATFDYTLISYNKDILKWLEHCAAVAYDKPKVRETIIQYKHLLTQITVYYMNEKNQIVEEIASQNEYLKNAILICSYQNDIIKKAISGPITKALEYVKVIAKEKTKLEVSFVPNEFYEKSGKLDWGFSYYITKNQKTIRLSYIFENWGLMNLYYGILKDGTSQGIAVTPIFKYSNENWPWGWDWISDKYNNWSGESLYNIIDELSDNTYDSCPFCDIILDSILKSSQLLNE